MYDVYTFIIKIIVEIICKMATEKILTFKLNSANCSGEFEYGSTISSAVGGLDSTSYVYMSPSKSAYKTAYINAYFDNISYIGNLLPSNATILHVGCKVKLDITYGNQRFDTTVSLIQGTTTLTTSDKIYETSVPKIIEVSNGEVWTKDMLRTTHLQVSCYTTSTDPGSVSNGVDLYGAELEITYITPDVKEIGSPWIMVDGTWQPNVAVSPTTIYKYEKYAPNTSNQTDTYYSGVYEVTAANSYYEYYTYFMGDYNGSYDDFISNYGNYSLYNSVSFGPTDMVFMDSLAEISSLSAYELMQLLESTEGPFYISNCSSWYYPDLGQTPPIKLEYYPNSEGNYDGSINLYYMTATELVYPIYAKGAYKYDILTADENKFPSNGYDYKTEHYYIYKESCTL